MLSSLPCFYAFCWSAIPTSCYIFNVFYSCSCHFLLAADACLSWSLSSITEQHVSPHRLHMQYCSEEKWRRKGSHSFSVSGSNRLMWLQTWKKAMGWCTAQWKMLLFCAKTIVKVTQIWTSPSEEEEEEEERKKNILAIWWLSGTWTLPYLVFAQLATFLLSDYV